MDKFDYSAEAELFPSRSRASRRQPVGYRRFACAAEAIRFAIEDLPADLLAGSWLEVDENRFNAQEIRQLYDHGDYPLQRQPPVSHADGPSAANSPSIRSLAMANREQRHNREKRKPKAEKSSAPSAQTSPFARGQGVGNIKGVAAKKGH